METRSAMGVVERLAVAPKKVMRRVEQEGLWNG